MQGFLNGIKLWGRQFGENDQKLDENYHISIFGASQLFGYWGNTPSPPNSGKPGMPCSSQGHSFLSTITLQFLFHFITWRILLLFNGVLFCLGGRYPITCRVFQMGSNCSRDNLGKMTKNCMKITKPVGEIFQVIPLGENLTCHVLFRDNFLLP